MKAFLSSLNRSKRYVVAELFFVYFAQGLSSIMLGSVLPDLRAAYALDYQIGGTLLHYFLHLRQRNGLSLQNKSLLHPSQNLRHFFCAL